ncbi:MAG TPA: toll/interleukin-1 receptor domain-containing protein [Actinobacteria bacterium]|nr:hypothetical protein BMS3Bbin01_02447 [bacterium BMS3Bbin01]HDH25736.1 toll/interleukin-1 receptor domain-containing protein [Actinomycetota bacterium]
MDEHAAFFSYSHFDDRHDGDYLSRLRMRLADEVQMQTGIEFRIFQDREDILIGYRWRELIDDQLDSTTFLIVVLTPSFFKSDECRKEVNRFREREEVLGVEDLIIPIYYVDAAEMDSAFGGDDLAADLRERQYADWRELRFEELDSKIVRKELAALARQIAERLRRPIVTKASAVPLTSVEVDKRDTPGAIELLAEMEEAFPIMVGAIQDLGEEVNAMGSLATEATADIRRSANRPNPSRGKLAAIQRYAQRLSGPADRIETIAAEYRDQLNRVDSGIDGMLALIRVSDDEEDLQAAEELHKTLGELSRASTSGLGSIETLVGTMDTTQEFSSSLRPVFGTIRTALIGVVDTLPTIQSWESRVGEGIAEARRQRES